MDRSIRILELLSTKKEISINDLCDVLYCSQSSLRRDLIQLEKTGSVCRIRGGAKLITGSGIDYSLKFREGINKLSKEKISYLAQDFLSSGLSIFLDSTTTVVKICPYIEKFNNIKVTTNGINTAMILNNYQNIETFVTGGVLRKGSASLLGEMAGLSFDNFKADVSFISCRGVSAEGLLEANHEQALIKQHMIKNSKLVIALIDSSKFGVEYFHRLCDFSMINTIITDKAPSEEIEQAIRNSDCELLY